MALPDELGFATAYFDLPGLRLHAAVAGPADGPLVLLLHGFPEFWYSWRHQIGLLARAGYRVVVPDQRGYNLTGPMPPYDIDTLVADVVHLIEACGRQRAFVAGHDWGAGVAWSLAAPHPERVERLAILNVPHPGALVRALRRGDLRQGLKSWYMLFFQIPILPEYLLGRDDFRVLRRSLVATSNPGSFAPADLDRFRDAWARPGALAAMIGWYRALRRSRRVWRPDSNVMRVRVPTLILWGDHDVALRAELADASLDWVDDGRLVHFPAATHWLQQDEPKAVTRHLLDHFGGV